MKKLMELIKECNEVLWYYIAFKKNEREAHQEYRLDKIFSDGEKIQKRFKTKIENNIVENNRSW